MRGDVNDVEVNDDYVCHKGEMRSSGVVFTACGTLKPDNHWWAQSWIHKFETDKRTVERVYVTCSDCWAKAPEDVVVRRIVLQMSKGVTVGKR